MHKTDFDMLGVLAPSQKLAAQLRRDLHELGAVPVSRALASLTATAVSEGSDEVAARGFAESAVRALVLCGDIGSGQSYGDRILLKKRERAMLYQGDRCILLGGEPERGEPHGLLRAIDDVPADAVSFLHGEGQLSASELAELDELLARGAWSADAHPSDAIMHLLCIVGLVPGQPVPEDTSEWLREHFLFAAQSKDSVADPSQSAVIQSLIGARQVVTAGPGSGKTHTATERVIHLVEQGMSPARICLITFTRVAAEEVGRRISEALEEHTYSGGVMCGTIDSMAWNLVTTIGDAPAGGYERIVRTARKMIADGEQVMLDQLSRISHLVIDEAQDIVGERRDFCRALIDALPPDVGITILGDGAQAIYGSWAGDTGKGGSLHGALANDRAWDTRQLTSNHRTRSVVLRQFFREARDLLDREQDQRATYLELRDMLLDVATDPNVSLTGPVLPWRDDSLILFRGRAATEAASVRLTRAARVHRLKLSGQTTVCDPLIGAICAGVGPGTSIRRDHIRRRLAGLHPGPFGLTEEDALLRLQALGGGAPAIRPQDIGEMIDRQPVEFTCDHVGTAGPLLGSIHGAKGREAPNVLLMLPPVPYGDDVDWLEEARVLFVGATRASENLYIGRAQGGAIRFGVNRSRWLRGKGGGLILSGSDGLRPLSGGVPALAVWEAAFSQPHCNFQRAKKAEEPPWQLVTDAGEILAEAHGALADDLDYLTSTGGEIAAHKIRIVGATTVVDRRSDGRINGITLLPVLQGVAQSAASMENVYEQ